MSAGPRSRPSQHFAHLEAADAGCTISTLAAPRSTTARLFFLRSALRERARPRRRVTGHLVDDAGARCEVSFNRLSGRGIDSYDLAAVSGADPEAAIRSLRDAAGRGGLGIERPEFLALVGDEVRLAAGRLIDNPQALVRCLKSIGLRGRTRGIEHSLHFG